MLLSVIDAGYALSLIPARMAFARATLRVEAFQQRHLQRTLQQNQRTVYGVQHRFAEIRSLADYQRRVPVVGYDEVAPWVTRLAEGERHLLTAEPVRLFEPTSGSTGQAKLIPYTQGLLSEFSAATGAWLADLYAHYPLSGTTSYWSLSPATPKVQATPAGIPVGFADDTEYFGRLTRWAVRQKLAVPVSVRRAPSFEAWRESTVRALLAASDLGLISVWSPTFLSLLMRYLEANFESLVTTLPRRHEAAVRARVEQADGITARALWPKLRLLSCWTEASAQLFVPELMRWFAGVPIQGKGLVATEGIVSLPWGSTDAGSVAAITSHFLELQPLDQATHAPLGVHQARVGASYEPIVTTAGGLYRYRLGDVVTCTGFVGQAPLLRLLGRRDKRSDLCGEKLDALAVEQALQAVCTEVGITVQFALVAPLLEPRPAYCLLVESEADAASLQQVALGLERRLCDNFHYQYCRELGQLGPLSLQRTERGFERYAQVLSSRGVALGSIKPMGLTTELGWPARLQGRNGCA